MPVKVAVLKETGAGEQRVALVPGVAIAPISATRSLEERERTATGATH